MRPWGLAAPVAVLIVCLPLLRPLRSPEPTQMSDNEAARIATIQAIVEHRTLAIDHSSFVPKTGTITVAEGTRPASGPAKRGERHYSKQPPVLAALLAGPYWIMHRFGLTLDKNWAVATYLLTLIGATLPVALAAGVVYRMGRLLELLRPWRTLLSFAAVFGSGLISYATVLNAHAPAAALILVTCGALFHAGMARQRGQSHGWLALAGLAAGSAAVIDLGTTVFLVLFTLVILAMQWPRTSKIGGVLWYVLGALPPVALHVALTASITGDVRPGFLHPELMPGYLLPPAQQVDEAEEWDEDEPSWLGRSAWNLVDGLVGKHGIFSHFPVLIMGMIGVSVVLRRHWPAATKTLAVVTLAGGAIMVLVYACVGADWEQPMYAVRWFVPFLPLVVFWSGAWLRKQHHPAMWTAAAVLLGFSVLTTLLGATAPFADSRYGGYTAYVAARQLWSRGRTTAERDRAPAIVGPEVMSKVETTAP